MRKAMKEVAAERPRFGYRRIHIMLERQGIYMNQKKLRRLYREEGLQVRRRGGRKRALGTRRPLVVPETINERSLSRLCCANRCRATGAWTSFRTPSRTGAPLGERAIRLPATGFRVLAVVDDFSRECLALVPDRSLSGARLTRELDAIIQVRGMPITIVSPSHRYDTSTAGQWTMAPR